MSYKQGFMDKCAQYGVNPDELIKNANILKDLAYYIPERIGKAKHLGSMLTNKPHLDTLDDWLTDSEMRDYFRHLGTRLFSSPEKLAAKMRGLTPEEIVRRSNTLS